MFLKPVLLAIRRLMNKRRSVPLKHLISDTLGPNQMCSIFGSTPGNPNVSGSDYMAVGYSYYKAHIWRNVRRDNMRIM